MVDTSEETASQFRSAIDCLLDEMVDAGGILNLWEKVAKWGVKNADFRTWCLRAAMAQGHAEWLQKEVYHVYSKTTP